jgi:hypothetical protein
MIARLPTRRASSYHLHQEHTSFPYFWLTCSSNGCLENHQKWCRVEVVCSCGGGKPCYCEFGGGGWCKTKRFHSCLNGGAARACPLPCGCSFVQIVCETLCFYKWPHRGPQRRPMHRRNGSRTQGTCVELLSEVL